MSKAHTEPHFEAWFSTYGLLTAERILEYFSIKLPHSEVQKFLKQSTHMLFRVLHVPLMNIFNGIILQQAYDYQVYAQKLMIDYRLSPEYEKDPESPGANIREDLNEQYDQLLNMTKAFSHHQYKHYQVISETQAYLISRIGGYSDPLAEIELLRDDVDFNEILNGYRERAQEMMITFKSYRQQFYDIILAMTERLASLSEYKFDVAQAEKEREALFFDKGLGAD